MSLKSPLELTGWDFDYTVASHKFCAVLFFHPRFPLSTKFLEEYEKAAIILKRDNQQIYLAAVDVSKRLNKRISIHFKICGIPRIMIFRDRCTEEPEEYRGPRDAEGIADCLKRISCHFPSEINSPKDVIGDKTIEIVGFFPDFSGREYDNFNQAAEKLKWNYNFRLTKHLPDGECGPLVRMYNVFKDRERYHEIKDFDLDALVAFLEETSPHFVTLINEHHPRFVENFFYNETENDKAMLLTKHKDDDAPTFISKYYRAAKKYRGRAINFMLGVLEVSEDALQYFGLTSADSTFIIIKNPMGKIYSKTDLWIDHDDIEVWVDDYKAGRLAEFGKSDPIPENNDGLVEVVVADNFSEKVMESGKLVLLEVHRSTCGNFDELAVTLNEVAIRFKNNDHVLIARLDETGNDIRSTCPGDMRTIGDGPTLYFITPEYVDPYEGPLDVDGIVEFIELNESTLPKKPRTIERPRTTEDMDIS